MTVRLVTLMSVVLLLCLAAFGLLVGHYQDRVMQEVARTASAASRATLETLDSGDAEHLLAVAAMLPPGAVTEPRATSDIVPDGAPRTGPDAGPAEPGSERAGSQHMRRTVLVRDESEVVKGTAVSQSYTWIEGPGAGPPAGDCEELRALLQRIDEGAGVPAEARFFIDIEEVRAETEPAADVVMLRIPTFTESKGPADGEVRFEYRVRGPGAPADPILLARNDELRLPIKVDDYQTLFQSLRRRSLLLFVAVFVVGTVLSAGLATRFTRPIRRLDAGIRRLSEGDLDVEVAVAGRDEVARLGDAFNDMTRKLRAGRDRSRELVRREKLSALGGLAAGVAHDVRNPLHSIGLTLSHLADTCRPEDGERAGEFDRAVGIIRGEIRRLDQLVGNFLRFSRSERRERQPVDLADLLRETARLIAKEAEWRRIEISLDLLETAPPVSADAETLRASLLNLVMNSFHAMPEGGKLALRLWVEREDLVVEVADTGCGIPAEELDRVFEFAYTTREGGNGLGLAMVHECVVEQHGGRVDLDSAEGRGTTVRLALPIRPHQREEA